MHGTGWKVVALAACVAGLALALLGVEARAATLEEAVDKAAAEMVSGAQIAPGGHNVAVVQFAPALGEELKLGNYLVRKVRIRMFEDDRERTLRFVSQGLVIDILVKEGLQSQSVIFDESQRLKLGQLLTADMLVHGSYELLGGGNVEIVTYLTDVKSGVTLAQSVQKASGVGAHLLLPVSAPATVARYARISGSQRSSDAEAAKQYKMAEIFAKRGRPERERELLEGIVRDYPNSQEAVFSQLRIMNADLEQLRADKEYNEDFYRVVAELPAAYKSHTLYTTLRENTVQWLTELARYEFSGGGQEDVAVGYYEKAKALGLPRDQARELEDLARATKVRAELRQGNRDQAELMLVEWEVDSPKSALRKLVQKEFERPEGMVTIPGGKVNGLTVDPFNMDIYETTNAEFLEFVKANPDFRKSRMTRERNDGDYLKRWEDDFVFPDELRNIPVVFVSAVVAEAYCKWRKKRLPRSVEWGLAAGEGRRKYPWGDQPPDREIANFNKGLTGDPLPGDSHPKGVTPEGVYHMGGNVWESTSTRVQGQSVARGGSYYDDEEILRNDNRKLSTDPPTYSSRFTGFRCVE